MVMKDMILFLRNVFYLVKSFVKTVWLLVYLHTVYKVKINLVMITNEITNTLFYVTQHITKKLKKKKLIHTYLNIILDNTYNQLYENV